VPTWDVHEYAPRHSGLPSVCFRRRVDVDAHLCRVNPSVELSARRSIRQEAAPGRPRPWPSVERQRVVSIPAHGVRVPDENTTLLHRLIGGDLLARGEVLDRAATSVSPSLLVAAALIDREPRFLVRAAEHSTTTRDRQLVALADAHLRGDGERLDVLVRDHLSEHPDNLLASWIAGRNLPRP